MPALTGNESPYPVPPAKPMPLVYRGLPLDRIEDLLVGSGVWKEVDPFLLPKEEITGGRPITPLHAGHVGLLCTAGLLNGVFGDGSDRHIARWRTVKTVTVFEVQENGFKEIHKRERFTNELALVYEDGRTLVLGEEKKKEDSNAECTSASGRLEYVRHTEGTNTHVWLHVDRYMGDGEQAHLLSIFGGDAEVGAIRAAIYERHTFTVTFPNGTSKTVQLGPDASCYNSSILLGPKRSIRHRVGVSAALQANGSAGMTYLVHLDGETKGLAWSTVVSLLGLPADPGWGDVVLGGMRRDKLIRRLDGIGCDPAVVQGTREDLMERIGEARKAGFSPSPSRMDQSCGRASVFTRRGRWLVRRPRKMSFNSQ